MTHVAFLRAINVGGRGLVKMTDLQAAFTAAGCADVRTVIASGNVLFTCSRAPGPALRAAISRNVGRLLGAEPAVVYRTLPQLEGIVDAAPFGPLADDKRVKVYVAFLVGKPKRRPRFPVRLEKEALEAIGTAGDDVLIVSRQKPNGMYGFPANWIEEEVGVPATVRTWGTVSRIVTLGHDRSRT